MNKEEADDFAFDFSCIRLFIHLSAKNISRSIGQGNISALKIVEDSFFKEM